MTMAPSTRRARAANDALPVKRYPVLAGESRAEETIERSRFITSLGKAESLEAARSFVDQVSAEFQDASHSCHAFLVGPPGSSACVGMSDAGEPHGTAGRPMLTVLLHSGVGDVAAVVTRYFGGVKLGKGGLVRAYGGCLKRALEVAERVERVDWRRLRIDLEYALHDPVRRVLSGFDVVLEGEHFAARVEVTLRVPEDREAELREAIREATSGKASLEEISEG